MTALVLRGDARALPLPDASVDLIVTSPPYYGLRSYTDGGQHYDGQIGAESTPAEYVAALVECTREWIRALKPEGSIFVNLGDAYYSGKGAPGRTTVDAKSTARTARRRGGNPLDGPSFGIGKKSLVGLPWRYALGCIDDLGLILRAEVIWSKPNGLPESVTDRVRRSHEQWFHLTKSPRYFSAVDEIREEHTSGAHGSTRAARRDSRADFTDRWPGRHDQTDYRVERDHKAMNPLGKLPGSVWEIATRPLKVPAELAVDHFAAFPMEWPRRIILGWSPAGICIACGVGRRPVTRQTQRVPNDRLSLATRARTSTARGTHAGSTLGYPADTAQRQITGYACACTDTTAPARPAVIVDPFGGTGTTALVADVLGRHGISIDRSADYCRLAAWRTTDPGERARALGVPPPPPVPDGQLTIGGAL